MPPLLALEGAPEILKASPGYLLHVEDCSLDCLPMMTIHVIKKILSGDLKLRQSGGDASVDVSLQSNIHTIFIVREV